MKIVLGLGNPGERYRRTRHNLGHWVIDVLAERWGAGCAARIGRAAVAEAVRVEGQEAVLARSRTYMNRSGRAAVALREHYGVEPGEMLVVYDDADLELGRIRIRKGGGAGGHNGMRSLIAALGSEEMPRIRLGILGRDRDRRDLADYVLEEFDSDEEAVAQRLVELAADAVESAIAGGIEEAMNRFNGLTADEASSDNG